MSSRIAISIFAAFVCLMASAASAANDKELHNVRGSVSYQNGASPKPLALNATTVLGDKDYAITGDASLATVGLPDSSRVLVGSDSKVQLGFFNQAQGTNANFVLYNGKIRFAVQHPAGAKANYTFSTPTASIAVRGTEGDIEIASDQLRVNVYEVCDSSEPVTVTTKDGKAFQLMPGQSLFAKLVNGVIRAQVQQISQQLIDQFAGDFGAPTSWDSAKGQIVALAQAQTTQAQSALDSATGGYGGQLAGAVGGLFAKKKPQSTPTPAAVAASDTCTHP